jgi:predicted Rossmann-fold nucleotide-binding protein
VRVLVCGSRDAKRYGDVAAKLDEIHAKTPITLVIHGAQRGVDLFAEQWAKSREVPYLGVPARWTDEGRAAGPRRNRRMIEPWVILADQVVAFPGGIGTADMKQAAREAGFHVEEVRP